MGTTQLGIGLTLAASIIRSQQQHQLNALDLINRAGRNLSLSKAEGAE